MKFIRQLAIISRLILLIGFSL